jgi:hypothetical protein
MPPQYYPQDWTQTKRQEFDTLCELWGINQFFATELRNIICAPEKVIIVDNSGSMNRTLKESHLMSNNRLVTRYDELREFMMIAISLLSIDSEHGITLVFLNAPVPGSPQYIYTGIHGWGQVSAVFSYPPVHRTPLIHRYQEQYERVKNNITEQGVLFFIATDGEPSDEYDYYGARVGNNPGRVFCKLIKDRPEPQKFIVNFLMCTDNDDEVACYDKLDREAICVDVSDDYNAEKAQVNKVRRGKPFTFGDYVVKALVGGACAKFDSMDEGHACSCTLC